jgi:hypothetical protein
MALTWKRAWVPAWNRAWNLMADGLQAALVDPPTVKAQSRRRESALAAPLPQNGPSDADGDA